MKKYYSFGEMVLALRSEYNEVKPLLEELNKYVHVDDKDSTHHFFGRLSDRRVFGLDDRNIYLMVQRRYSEVLKKIQELKNKSFAQYKYNAYFRAKRKNDCNLGLEFCDVYTPTFIGEKYRPRVQLTHPREFTELVDQILASDLMQVKSSYFEFNNDFIELEFDNALISSCLGYKSRIEWDGRTDRISYDVEKGYDPALIDTIFETLIPSDELSEDWIKLLEKHEKDYGADITFSNDYANEDRKDIVTIKDITNSGTVVLSRSLK